MLFLMLILLSVVLRTFLENNIGRDRESNPRTMRRQFLVLCEGETEEAYVFFLKQRYRLPIKIVSKIIGSKISQRLIDRHKKELASDSSEIKVF